MVVTTLFNEIDALLRGEAQIVGFVVIVKLNYFIRQLQALAS
jgi:hypothetical protein